MVMRLIFAAVLAFVVTPAMAQVSAESFAERIQPMVGKPVMGKVTLSSARAEGDLLIIVLDTPSWEGLDRAQVPSLFLEGFCQTGDDRGFFKVSRLRVDTLDNGKDLATGQVVTKCPPPEPAK